MVMTRTEVEDFLFFEADLLDTRRYAEWVDLFDDSGVYWIPIGIDQKDPMTHTSTVYDTKRRLNERLVRMNSRYFWTQDPPSLMDRVIGNVRYVESAHDTETWQAKFVLSEVREHTARTLSGHSTYRLFKNQSGEIKIKEKVVWLTNRAEALYNLTFLI